MDPWPIEPALSLQGQGDLAQDYVRRLTDWRGAAGYLANIVQGVDNSAIGPEMRSRGYIASHAQIKLNSPDLARYKMPTQVDAPYLTEIVRICASASLNCIYVQGPIMARAMHGSQAERTFIRESRDAIVSAGLTLANPEPVPVVDDERGDTLFHVRWDLRDIFTARFAEMLSPLLLHSRK
jgi:hypothetical protein